MGRPELADLSRADDRTGWNATLAFHLAMMVQTLAWCHGTDRGSPRLTGSTIDGRHFVKASHTDLGVRLPRPHPAGGRPRPGILGPLLSHSIVMPTQSTQLVAF